MATTIVSPDALSRARAAISSRPDATPKPGLRNRGKVGKVPDGLPPNTPLSERKEQAAVSVDNFEGAPVTGRAAVIAAAAAGRKILPVGTSLRVYWAGSDEWYDTKVLGHRAQLVNEQLLDGQLIDGFLTFKHQCEYDGGTIEHDFGQQEYEVINLGSTTVLPEASSAAPAAAALRSDADDSYSLNYAPPTERTKEGEDAEEENAPPASPSRSKVPKLGLRGKIAKSNKVKMQVRQTPRVPEEAARAVESDTPMKV